MTEEMHCANAHLQQYLDHRGRFKFWLGNGYHAYIMKYGEHLSPRLAEYASHCLENVDGSEHYWSKEEVISALNKSKVEIPSCMTHADVHYLANKTYAKYAGAYLKTDAEILDMIAYKLKYKARRGDATFTKYMTHLMNGGHVIDFCQMM